MKRGSQPGVVKLVPRPERLRDRIRELAQDSKNIIWTHHIQQRMESRGLDADAVLRILRTGDPEGEPEEGMKAGDWKIKLTRKMRTGRIAGVVTAVIQDRRLILLTAEWEDQR